jgi:hypothetical protein
MNRMTIATIVVLVFNLLMFNLQAHEGRVTVHVVDESGNPIPNIEVGADFNNSMALGTGWGTGAPTQVKNITGKDGVCVLTGSGNLPSVNIGIRTTTQFYGAGGYGVSFTSSFLGRWQPWNPTVEVVLKKQEFRFRCMPKKSGMPRFQARSNLPASI